MVGFAKGDIAIGVEYMPYRQKPCLVIKEGNAITKYASFNNEESAREFMDLMAYIVGFEKFDWVNDDEIPEKLRRTTINNE